MSVRTTMTLTDRMTGTLQMIMKAMHSTNKYNYFLFVLEIII